ncbi:acriflavin resistance protein [Aureimonas endophytica]|uniref:Acriflavin resistance protein n=1 Tax=Aureimonas endophytica TaxID=2027858 RepID=A0A916ZFX7_9HYPH|nr:efflux RND transporter periplasmic adaptor subunit [Aureimonas endophytica]GGD94112.1 acriflavin resistance protein [Aureimonas endophytica]
MQKRSRIAALGISALGLAVAGCQGETAPPVPPAPAIAFVAAQPVTLPQAVTLTGTIAARAENNVSFRTSGQIVERFVDTGDHVTKGQVLARLDARVQAADAESAKAGLASAEAQAKQAAAAFARAQSLFGQGFTTRREFDQADQAQKVAAAEVEAAKARLASALETLSFTELRADADGLVTARDLDVGETAQAAATVFTIAWDGPRDALFDIYEALLIQGHEPPAVTVALLADPSVTTTGRIRQIAPSVDPKTGTVRVKVGLESVPAAMTLGATVSGTGTLPSRPVFVLPPAALTAEKGEAAVWLFDPASATVAARPVRVAAYRTDAVILDEGLQAGDRVVTEGTKLLRPGQTVRATEVAAR